MAPLCLSVICFIVTASQFGLCAAELLKVTTVLTEPYAQYTSLTALPNDLEGYIIDLLHDLGANQSFQFDTEVTPDGKYGKMVAGGSWDGMIGQVVTGKAHLAAGPLTETEGRRDVLEFIKPAFMNFDLAILMRKRDTKSDIRDVVDLLKYPKITYGIVDGGSTHNLFSTRTGVTNSSVKSLLRRMFVTMQEKTILPTEEDCVRRVRESTDSQPFAFVGERYTVDYHARRKPCTLTAIHGTMRLMYGNYSLAVKKIGSSADIKNRLSQGIENLKNGGRLEELYRKWWIERAQCSGVPSSMVATSGAAAMLVPVITAMLFRVASA